MKISVITATYNSRDTVCHTFASVLNQTYADIEYLVIDGGSTDGTVTTIQEWTGRFGGRMHWISEPDQGLYDAMNKGIRLATGDVIGLLNSDDYYTSPYILERVAEVLAEETLDAVYGDIHFVHPERLDRCCRYYSSRLFRPSWMRLGFMPAHPSFYAKRACYEQFGLYDTSYKIGADFELLLRFIFKNGIRTRYLPMDFVTMRTGGVSTSGMRSRIRIMREHLRAFHDNGIYTNIFLLSMRYVYKLTELRK